MKKLVWMLTADDYIEVVELALSHGKKPGDSMEEEFMEIMKKKNIQPLGTTDKDKDLLAGELREEGLKVLNLSEKPEVDNWNNEGGK